MAPSTPATVWPGGEIVLSGCKVTEECVRVYVASSIPKRLSKGSGRWAISAQDLFVELKVSSMPAALAVVGAEYDDRHRRLTTPSPYDRCTLLAERLPLRSGSQA